MVLTPILLYLLATLDAAFCGYRAAAGRNALIRKRRYYRDAMLRGALFGQVAVGIAAAALGLTLALAADRAAQWHDLMAAGDRMLRIYVPYAAVLAVAFLVRTARSVDLRSLTSTLVFGPLTLLRPVVLAAGVVWGLAAASRPALVAPAVLILTMMLSLERWLGRRYVPEPSA